MFRNWPFSKLIIINRYWENTYTIAPKLKIGLKYYTFQSEYWCFRISKSKMWKLYFLVYKKLCLCSFHRKFGCNAWFTFERTDDDIQLDLDLHRMLMTFTLIFKSFNFVIGYSKKYPKLKMWTDILRTYKLNGKRKKSI